MPPTSEPLTKYGSSFQTKVVTNLISDSAFLQTIYDLIQPEQFDTESKQWLVREIKAYLYEYKVQPTLDALKIKINAIKSDILKTSIIDELREVMKYVEAPDLAFIKDQCLEFCKNQELKSAIMKSVDMLQSQRYEEIKRLIDNAMLSLIHI